MLYWEPFFNIILGTIYIFTVMLGTINILNVVLGAINILTVMLGTFSVLCWAMLTFFTFKLRAIKLSVVVQNVIMAIVVAPIKERWYMHLKAILYILKEKFTPSFVS